MLLYIMRHGETSWNTDRRIQGRTDVELNENGLFLNGDRVVPISTEVFTLPDKYGNAKFIIDSVYSSYHFMGQRVW